MENIRTKRILSLFDLFYHCQMVEFQDIDNCVDARLFEGSRIYEDKLSHKTYQRDIRFLRNAGILQAEYSRKERCYLPVNDSFIDRNGEFLPPDLPENKTQRKYMERIIRLCTIMVQMFMWEVEDPNKWYRERYPMLSERTRQRDFSILREVGYKVQYEPENEFEPAGYYYDYPYK